VAEPADQLVADTGADGVVALGAGLVGLVDQVAQRVGDLGGPHGVGVGLGGAGEFAQHTGRSTVGGPASILPNSNALSHLTEMFSPE
jgi:hypothetical protein